MRLRVRAATLLAVLATTPSAFSQVPPSAGEVVLYDGLLAAAHNNDAATARALLAAGADPNRKDDAGRTAVHVAVYARGYEVLPVLVLGGADIDALDRQYYDAVTIAAVAGDVRMVKLAIELGCDPRKITSPYDGTALIAAAHLGHVAVVKALIAAGAPLDHVNNLGWTALIEAVILGDGGERHTEIVKALVAAGADRSIADRNSTTPLGHARQRGYAAIIDALT